MSSSSSLFSSAIEHHLELKRRNQHLEQELPLDSFETDGLFDNHPLFKSEADARREEDETGEHPVLSIPVAPDTMPMPVVEPQGDPSSWMETSSVSDFSWD